MKEADKEVVEYGGKAAIQYGDKKGVKYIGKDAAKEVSKGGSETITGIENLLNNRHELTGTTREKLLATVQDSQLYKIFNELYRAGATVSDEGTASIFVQEFNNGSSKHLIKATDRLM